MEYGAMGRETRNWTKNTNGTKFRDGMGWHGVGLTAEAEEAERNHFKILLLGAGESGKSTVLK